MSPVLLIEKGKQVNILFGIDDAGIYRPSGEVGGRVEREEEEEEEGDTHGLKRKRQTKRHQAHGICRHNHNLIHDKQNLTNARIQTDLNRGRAGGLFPA